VAVRERLAFDEPHCAQALSRFGFRFPCAESLILSTCNRTELYLARPVHGHPRLREAIEFLAEEHRIPLHEFSSSLYHYEDAEAVRHLFRVVSSLDSMVVGESQILAQTKRALELARTHLPPKSHLMVLFQRAFAVAKDVHSRTQISAGRLSIGSVAIDFARQIFARFDDKTVLLLGTGKMGELTLRHLLELHPRRMVLINRSAERAAVLAQEVGAAAQPWERLSEALVEADIVLCSTGAAEPIITAASFAAIPQRRRHRPLLMIDLAVPRDIDPAVGEHEGVFLYNIDDLQKIADQHWQDRQAKLEQSREIVEAGVAEFFQWQAAREVGPVIRELQARLGSIAEGELEWLRPKLKNASPDDLVLIEQMLGRLVGKMLHDPSRALTEKSENGRGRIYVDTVRRLFNLEEGE
jgi:glutamyl-tRNA reductase